MCTRGHHRTPSQVLKTTLSWLLVKTLGELLRLSQNDDNFHTSLENPPDFVLRAEVFSVVFSDLLLLFLWHLPPLPSSFNNPVSPYTMLNSLLLECIASVYQLIEKNIYILESIRAIRGHN